MKVMNTVFMVCVVVGLLIAGCSTIQKATQNVVPTPTPSETRQFSNDQVSVVYESSWMTRSSNTSEFEDKLKQGEDVFHLGVIVNPKKNNTEILIDNSKCVLTDSNGNLYQPIRAMDQTLSLTGAMELSIVYHWFSYGIPKNEIPKSFTIRYWVTSGSASQEKIPGSITIPI
jgi:hypothetical protein